MKALETLIATARWFRAGAPLVDIDKDPHWAHIFDGENIQNQYARAQDEFSIGELGEIGDYYVYERKSGTVLAGPFHTEIKAEEWRNQTAWALGKERAEEARREP
ncbi:hypothetical protein LCGC14_2034390 [marine sediment metagenome]|uniref:Uncharacterized protein n=1 Tax=marine sediment metagenome TaxID=412755 RepID=A0A0F9ETZ3_9ZZZZ